MTVTMRQRLRHYFGTGTAADGGIEGRLADDRVRCLDTGCTNVATSRCAYIDRRQVRCDTHRCVEHIATVSGQPYCSRHASVVTAVSNDLCTEILPDVDEGAPSLVSWVGGELGAEIDIALIAEAPSSDAFVVAGVTRATSLRDGTAQVWMRSWSLVDNGGILQQVSIEVDDQNDHALTIRVGGELVGRHEPRRIGGDRRETMAYDEDESARQAFRDAVMHDVKLGLLAARLGELESLAAQLAIAS